MSFGAQHRPREGLLLQCPATCWCSPASSYSIQGIQVTSCILPSHPLPYPKPGTPQRDSDTCCPALRVPSAHKALPPGIQTERRGAGK